MDKWMILDKEITPRRFTIAGEEETLPASPQTAIPMEAWLAWAESTAGDASQQGGIVAPDENVDSLAAHLDRASFVAISFPKFADGRGYSHARRLRKNHGYEGLVLAFGDVLRDQLMHMHRCGINGLYLREDQDMEAAMEVFERFTDYYQDGRYTP